VLKQAPSKWFSVALWPPLARRPKSAPTTTVTTGARHPLVREKIS
jgi:hypothetical protein